VTFGEVLWAMLVFFLFIIWIYLLISIFVDIFRSGDLSGWGKAGWTIFIIVLPFLGVFIYLIARGASMHERSARDVAEAQAAQDEYIRQVGGSDSTADELSKLKDLRDEGVLSDDEFEAQKAELLS
jgi:hypothetical protein